MAERMADASPRRLARVSGVLFLVTLLTGVFAEIFVSDRLVVGGDATATAANILANQSLYRLGFTAYLVEMACNVAFTALFYQLLRPAGRSVSWVALTLGLVGCTIKTVSRLFYIAPLLVLEGPPYLRAFSTDQSQALALLMLRVNGLGAGMALAFFGFSTLLNGYLIIRSGFLPRFLGALSLLGGLGWLTFLSPPLGYRLFPYVAAFGLLASAGMIGWLLIVGVNEPRWKERAGIAGL